MKSHHIKIYLSSKTHKRAEFNQREIGILNLYFGILKYRTSLFGIYDFKERVSEFGKNPMTIKGDIEKYVDKNDDVTYLLTPMIFVKTKHGKAHDAFYFKFNDLKELTDFYDKYKSDYLEYGDEKP